MKINFYQVAITVFLVGLFGYFLWPTLYTYEDISIRKLNGYTDEFYYEEMRLRVHRINGLAERDHGMNRWSPYTRIRKCDNGEQGVVRQTPCEIIHPLR